MLSHVFKTKYYPKIQGQKDVNDCIKRFDVKRLYHTHVSVCCNAVIIIIINIWLQKYGIETDLAWTFILISLCLQSFSTEPFWIWLIGTYQNIRLECKGTPLFRTLNHKNNYWMLLFPRHCSFIVSWYFFYHTLKSKAVMFSLIETIV